MWGFLGPLLELVGKWLSGRNAVGERKNTPEMQQNAKAEDTAKATDRVEELVNKAQAGDEKAVDELRKELGE